MKKNILFSTTRQWNPGDEFILMGCINILKEVFGEFNPIIYNRNPEVRQGFSYINPFRKARYSNIIFPGKPILESFVRVGFLDNSFKDDSDGGFIDLAVFAGSPEWVGRRLMGMYKAILRYKIPVIYLGIGSGGRFKYNRILSIYKEVLGNAKLITVRDRLMYDSLKDLSPVYMPCPALLCVSAGEEKSIEEVKKIGLIFGTYKTVKDNKVSIETYKKMLILYKEIIRGFKNKLGIEIVCHYIDELPEANKEFEGINIHYSYDSRDYIDIYKEFDLVIGQRVHGIGISASMGIPGILLAHDIRGDTGKGFLAFMMSIDSPIERILELIEDKIKNIKSYNNDLIRHKLETKDKYTTLIKNIGGSCKSLVLSFPR